VLSGCSDKPKNTQDSDNITWDKECDVVVVGSGAGLLAALEAAEAGASVILLEKVVALGGATAFSGGNVQAAGTKVQADAGIKDTSEDHWKAFQASNGKTGQSYARYDEEFAKQLIENVGSGVDRLLELGCEFTVQHLASNAPPRQHLLQPSAGAWTNVLSPAAEERGVEILTSTPAIQLITNIDGDIHGVKAQSESETFNIKARKGVILATGDCSNAEDIKGMYMDARKAAVSNPAAGSTGDGLRMAAAVGAGLSMNSLYANGNYLRIVFEIGNNFEGSFIQKGTIFVNSEGKRFTNETSLQTAACDIYELEGSPVYAVFGTEVAELTHRSDPHDATAFLEGKSMGIAYTPGLGYTFFEDAEEKGCLFQGETVRELADAIGVPVDALSDTVATWNAIVESGEKDEFERTLYKDVSDRYGPTSTISGPFYAFKQTVVRNHGIEGPCLLVNLDYQVEDFNGEPIPRLYACGAGLTQGGAPNIISGGGVHMMGNIVSARIAAAGAARLDSWE
jgi:fumarate reductase flavoprotein subunit